MRIIMWIKMHAAFYICALILILMSPASCDMQDFCISESFQASCAEDEVIAMDTANYGRMRIGRCVQTDFGFVGCSTSVLSIADRRCSGRRRCVLRVADPLLEARTPCNAEFKSYLETNYSCVQVATAPESTCQSSGSISLPIPSGHIANVVTEETRCGSANVPWLIEAKPGQRINFTLYDFATPSPSSGGTDTSNICYLYALITEVESGHKVNVCAKAAQRQTHAYLSVSNAVEVRIVLKQNLAEKGYFMLQYNVVGCEDPIVGKDMWMRRTGDNVYVGCNSTKRAWTISCENNEWQGHSPDNCSDTTAVPGTKDSYGGMDAVSRIISLPVDIAIVLILAVAFVVGVIIFVIGLVALRRRHANLSTRRQQAMMMREAHEHTLRKMHPMEEYRPEPYTGHGGGGGMGPGVTKIHIPGDSSNENEYAYVWDSPHHHPQAYPHGPYPHVHSTGTGTMPRKFSDPGLPMQRGTLLRGSPGGELEGGDTPKSRGGQRIQCYEMDQQCTRTADGGCSGGGKNKAPFAL